MADIPAQPPSPPTAPMPPQKTPYVMIVEDDAFLVRAYEVMLTSQGYTVQILHDGEAALAALKQGPAPAVVLLDLMLPKKSGFELMEDLRKDPIFQQLPIIVLSNLGQPSDIERAQSLGAKEYFVKADTPLERVVATVQKYLPLKP